ncbi:MAG TPA: 2-oxoacid:acceptor oxidoreductase subunit alpha [Aliiroseovarius sp.]|nr:2-oxoacid:acceptor oxidoreductase subunit alpha [Aliiroseovarius sp.]
MAHSNAQASSRNSDVAFAIVGTGGKGAITAGAILLEAAGKSGWHGLSTRSVGPQIRGGEAAALVRLSTRPAFCMARDFNILVALDWKNADRFITAMPVAPGGIVIADPGAGAPPQAVLEADCTIVECPIGEMARAIDGGRENMIAVGIVAQLIGLGEEEVMQVVASKLGRKGPQAVETGRVCLVAGMQAAEAMRPAFPLEPAPAHDSRRWLITGNEAMGQGLMRGGVRFAAAYPITPATEILEYLAPALAQTGGALLQAEDELASINMIIGASFGGRPSVTATSGPGLSLMMEGLGLAAASETPVVVVDVMRVGPSTGIATKSEQSDLNIAVHGFHGDAPHVVMAPLSVSDCLFTGQWAVHVAESLQTPVIVLSDQSIGQARVLIDRPADVQFLTRRKTMEAGDTAYQRYAITADGVSPMAIPGMPGGQYTADGLTHNPRGAPSSTARDQRTQMDKRAAKIDGFDFGDHWGVVEGEANADIVVLTWGSMAGAAREALAGLAEKGIKARLVAVRLVSPLPCAALEAALAGARRILVVEQNRSGQFLRLLRSEMDLAGEVRHLGREGPDLIRPDEIAAHIRDWSAS